MNLKNKVVIVTGGAGLLGKSFIEAIADHDGIAIIADINSEAGVKVKDELLRKNKNYKIDNVNLDIVSKTSINKMINEVINKYNKIDAIINNAYPRNKNYGRDFLDVEYEDFCENVNLHLGGYFLVCQQLIKFFLKQEYGNIINISSIYGVVAPRFELYNGTKMTTPVEYAAIKSAIIHLTKYMAKYLKDKNIRINSLSLGGIFDNQPQSFLEAYKKNCLNKGMLNEKDIIGTLIFLLSDKSQYVNGQNIVVDDGFTL
ncbi:MAG: oxidoreductase [Spirochaetia bacterium]|nr:oxidoreductase [Spirochaetia bacterium]